VEKGVSPRTVEAYGRDVSAFLATAVSQGLISRDASERSWEHLDDQRGLVRHHLARLRQAGRSKATVARHLASIRAFYRYLQLTGRVRTVPANLASGRGGRERKLPRNLSEKMLDDLLLLPDLSTLRGLRDRALLEMIYGLGLRLAEVVDLDLGRLNWPGELVRVVGKGRKERILPLVGCARESLAAYLGRRLEPASWLDLQDGILRGDLSRQPASLSLSRRKIPA